MLPVSMLDCGKPGRKSPARLTASTSEGRNLCLADKVQFLGSASTHPQAPEVTCRETHMSWIFLAGERVYKLKKPVTFPFLDFSTLSKRERACREELRLNRRLAPDVYLSVVPLTVKRNRMEIAGDGAVIDWLVVMRRLDESETLESRIRRNDVIPQQLDELVETLAGFYRRTARALCPSAVLANGWRESLSYNRNVLLDRRLGLPAGLIRRIDKTLRMFLWIRADLLAKRTQDRLIVDGHGDLRPEHIFIGNRVRIIDCLEFNSRLRLLDPFDELAFLSVECERLGARWIGDYVANGLAAYLHGDVGEELFLFYRCQRAMLRARLSIAHLLEQPPRTPEKWPSLTRAYLRIAAVDARKLDRLLRMRRDR